MNLSPSNLAYYLIARGQVTIGSVVDGDFCAIEMHQRNRNFKVLRGGQPGLFIKQVRSTEDNLVETLRREALCYQAIQSRPEFDRLTRLMPKFVDYDSSRHVLIVELIPDSENLAEFHTRLNAFPVGIGTLLGEQLGVYHSDVGRRVGQLPESDFFPRQPPWILSLHRQDQSMAKFRSRANTQLVETLHQYPDFEREIDRLREEWNLDSLIHGDLKFQNCLVRHLQQGLELRIVDWELADYGDAAWDVGGVLQAFLDFWIESMPFHSEQKPERFAAQAGYSIESMQPAIAEFWRAYSATRGWSSSEAAVQLLRCVRYGAARMIQTAFETSAYAKQIERNAVTMLQVSLNVLQNPQAARRDLFGIQ